MALKKNQKAGCLFVSGGCLLVCCIAGIGLLILIVGAVKMGSQQSNSAPVNQGVTSPMAEPSVKPEYTVEESDSIPGIKRSLIVHLKAKVTEDRLRTIAIELEKQKDRPYERTFIVYYLPGMDLNDVCWATTHFDPDLKIDINEFMEPGQSPLAKPAPQ
tara:strand:- start:828 stop:1304 length:477 start_codon:yes stop_codon:yes gene_type:complete